MSISAMPVSVTEKDRHRLKRMCRPSGQHRYRQRATIVLVAATGASNQVIADQLDVSRETVRKWRTRYATQGVDGLQDLPRPGRPKLFTELQQAQIKAIACTTPEADKQVPLARWSVAEIARQAVTGNIVETVSRFTVGRWLAEDCVKPWQTESWISALAPDFGEKGGIVIDLYHGLWKGEPIGDNDYVISTDEKPGIQALRRSASTPSLRPGGCRRVEFDYHRGGTLTYLAALDVGDGHVMGITRPTTGIAPFTDLVDMVMTQQPYKSADHVYWIADNGSSHRGWQADQRLHQAYPNAILVHTPVHASWLNQVEVFFSILSRKALNGASFNNLDDLANRILTFQTWYNQTCHPFNWKWTRQQLNTYLAKLPNLTPTN